MLDDVSQDFVLMLTANAEIVYVTENIKKRLGINQVGKPCQLHNKINVSHTTKTSYDRWLF